MDLAVPTIWLQNKVNSARVERKFLDGFLANDGVVSSSDYVVTAQATPDMSVRISAGQAWVRGDNTGQGVYSVTNDGYVTLTIPTSDNAARRDLIVIKIYDSEYGDSLNQAELLVIKGQAATTPVTPTLPDNAIPLAVVSVGAGSSSVSNSNIVDARVMALFRSEYTSGIWKDVAWTPITTWGPYATPYGSDFKAPSYRILADRIELSGLISVYPAFSSNGNHVLFTMPSDIAPLRNQIMSTVMTYHTTPTNTVLSHAHPTYEAFNTCLIYAFPDGRIVVYYGGSVGNNHWISLDSLTYMRA